MVAHGRHSWSACMWPRTRGEMGIAHETVLAARVPAVRLVGWAASSPKQHRRRVASLPDGATTRCMHVRTYLRCRDCGVTSIELSTWTACSIIATRSSTIGSSPASAQPRNTAVAISKSPWRGRAEMASWIRSELGHRQAPSDLRWRGRALNPLTPSTLGPRWTAVPKRRRPDVRYMRYALAHPKTSEQRQRSVVKGFLGTAAR